MNLRIISLFSIGISLGASLASAQPNLSPSTILKYIQVDKTGAYGGLTDYAKKLISESRDILRNRQQELAKNFRQFDTITHTAYVSRLAQGNMFLYGPPGGAKSRFVSWLFSQEEVPAFELQMHQMMTEQAFVGGQSLDSVHAGRFEINLEGTLAQAKVALIDEFDKGNPAALAALLSLLNERKVLAGGKVYHSPLETVFSTSNANLYEIYQQFAENGMRSTAAALLNRFTSIAFVPNWLSKQDQGALDDTYLHNLDSLFTTPETHKAHEKLILRWNDLRELAYLLVRPTEEFLSMLRELFDGMRTETIKAVNLAKEAAALNPSEESLPYYPSAEYTERLRQKSIDLVCMSVFLDLLESPLVNDLGILERTLKLLPYHRFPVGPASAWRAYLTLTTTTFGNVHIIFPTRTNGLQTITLEFDNFFMQRDSVTKTEKAYPYKDVREEQTIKYIQEEQRRFKTTFMSLLAHHKDSMEAAAGFSSMFACLQDTHTVQNMHDVERILFMSRDA